VNGAARAERGQAVLLLLGVLAAAAVGAFVLGAVARGIGVASTHQRAADLGALAGARALRDAYGRLFEPAVVAGVPNPRHLSRAAYLALGRAAALAGARHNGARAVTVGFPDAASFAPVRVRVIVGDPIVVAAGTGVRRLAAAARAEAELAPPADAAFGWATGGGYSGPLAYRQGKPMRPDVARAFDQMAAAAAASGIGLIVVSAFRSDREQAALFANHPDPKWVAPPGRSLHRLATELDLGPAGAYGWLAAHAGRFGFLKRYSWEPWHYGCAKCAMTGRRIGA
jgi:D-alanyl-D-alanine carboxypeptidase